MPPLVSPEVVEATWQRVGALDEAAMLALQRRAGGRQPELVGFVIGFTSELPPVVVGLGLYVLEVVLEMFRSAVARKLPKVHERVILRHWRANRAWFEELRGVPEFTPALVGPRLGEAEPWVVAYLAEALADTEDDLVGVTAEERWYLLAVLNTVVESFHEVASKQRT